MKKKIKNNKNSTCNNSNFGTFILPHFIKNNKNSTCIFCIKCGSMNVPKLELLLILIEEQDYIS